MTPTDIILAGHAPGAWSDEFPYTMCRECGYIDQAPPAPIPGSPPRWVLWLGRRFR